MIREKSTSGNVSVQVKHRENVQLARLEISLDINVVRIFKGDWCRVNGKVKYCAVGNARARREFVGMLLKSIYGDTYVTHDYETSHLDDSDKKNFTRSKAGLLNGRFPYRRGTMHYDAVVYVDMKKLGESGK